MVCSWKTFPLGRFGVCQHGLLLPVFSDGHALQEIAVNQLTWAVRQLARAVRERTVHRQMTVNCI